MRHNYAAITVAAMADVSEQGFGLAGFSSRGPTRDNRMKPEISAPGVDVTAPRANTASSYVTYSGTSMATPFVSGTIALMLAANPSLTVAQVRDILRNTALDWGPTGQDVDYGWGRLDAYEAIKAAGSFSGSGPAVPRHQTFSGRISTSGGMAEHTFNVTDADYPVAVTLIMPGWSSSSSPDFDLYVYDPTGAEIGRATGTSRQEQVLRSVSRTGTYKLVVKSYSGTGDYVVDVSAGMGGTQDQAPTVAIDQPQEGATVSGTIQVRTRAADDNGVTKVELSVDGGAYTDITGSFDGTHYTHQWNTASVANGDHTLTARATDSAGQQSTAGRRVTVANDSQPPTGEHEITRTGQVNGGNRDANVEFTVHETGYVDLSLTWNSAADLDFYVYAPDGAYIGRAYTVRKPETFRVDTARYGTGTYRVRVNLYSGPASSFTLSAQGYREEAFQGSVSATNRDATHTRAINFTGRGRAIMHWGNSSDLDFFVYDPNGRERARAYTLYNPEQADFTIDSTGTWSVRVNLYAGTGGSYTLRLFIPEAVLS